MKYKYYDSNKLKEIEKGDWYLTFGRKEELSYKSLMPTKAGKNSTKGVVILDDKKWW